MVIAVRAMVRNRGRKSEDAHPKIGAGRRTNHHSPLSDLTYGCIMPPLSYQ